MYRKEIWSFILLMLIAILNIDAKSRRDDTLVRHDADDASRDNTTESSITDDTMRGVMTERSNTDETGRDDATETSITNEPAHDTTTLLNIEILVEHYSDVVWDYVLRDYMTCVNINHDDFTVHMVTTTDNSKPSTHAKCIRYPSGKDVFEMVPAYSNAVHLHFKNMYCAAFISFHEYYVKGPEIYSTLTYWNIEVNLDCFMDEVNGITKYVPYNIFLLNLMARKSDCDIKFSPPVETETPIGFAEIPGCSLSVEKMCSALRLMKINDTDPEQSMCSLCAWVYREETCLNSLYIKYTDLVTHLTLQPPSDLFSHDVSKSCIDRTWMPTRGINDRMFCFEPIESVSGLIAGFWVKLLIWDNENTDVSDIVVTRSVKHVLNIKGEDLEIRIVNINEVDGKDELSEDYEKLEVTDRMLRCKSMYLAVWSKKYVSLADVKLFVFNIREIFNSSTRFVIGDGIELYLSLYEPSCFPTEDQKAIEQSSDDEYIEIIKELVSLSIGFSIPIVIFLVGACLSLKQYCTIQWNEES